MHFSEKPLFSAYQPRAWLRITGDDASSYLQGQVTCDLRTIQPGCGCYGLLLNQKGKVMADIFVLGGAPGHEFWVGSYFSPATVIRERLEAYVIADDVVIEDVTSAWAGFAVIGPAAESVVTGIKLEGLVFQGRRIPDGNIEWMVPISEREKVWGKIMSTGAEEISADSLEALRINAGIPAIPRDIGPGELPNEGGLEAVAISYTKGCYLGQEVIARLKSMGQVRRRLLRISGAGNIPALPATLFVGERSVGELRSAASDSAGGFTGLALVSLIHVKPGTVLTFGRDGTSPLRLIEVP
ncbi:MAG TPA: folate-binding protein [Opitutaceae bacterium]|nr:folate-binding protein [Opitutaceae bacterium]